MIVTPLDWELDNVIVAIDGDQPRSSGVHISHIIKSLETKYGRLRGRDDVGPENEAKWHNYRTAGFLIERVFRDLLKDLYPYLIRPGETCVDGIYMTPDYLDTRDWNIEEWKCTWRAKPADDAMWEALQDDTKFISWAWQIMAYCKAFGTLHARLRAFWVNGDYRPRKPLMKAWQLDFDQREIDENWMMLVNHGRNEGLIIGG